ncbi:hypothetical protein ACLK1Y_12880 [Escherichia coli]
MALQIFAMPELPGRNPPTERRMLGDSRLADCQQAQGKGVCPRSGDWEH